MQNEYNWGIKESCLQWLGVGVLAIAAFSIHVCLLRLARQHSIPHHHSTHMLIVGGFLGVYQNEHAQGQYDAGNWDAVDGHWLGYFH